LKSNVATPFLDTPGRTLNLPLLINCPMVVALYRWLDEAVQPAAREAFGRKRIPEDVQSLA
jgi:hypothetical protein